MTGFAANCGWFGNLHEFGCTPISEWLHSLKDHHKHCMLEPPAESQIKAWEECFQILQEAIPHIVAAFPGAANFSVVFEYELPRERGRRPDVVLIGSHKICVLEFKGHSFARRAHIDQVAAYVRDIGNYHAHSHGTSILPVLVLASGVNIDLNVEEVAVVSPDKLAGKILEHIGDDRNIPADVQKWLAADYAPLPSLVNAARLIFQHEPLPQIRRAQSAGIPATIAHLVSIAQYAREHRQRHLALVTGVPGAGKTLVGLKFVYENHFGDTETKRTAVFLSGNGPLVKVLQHALRSSIFVQDVHGYLKQYGGKDSKKVPEEHIWIYDEAQRAWDADRVGKKRGHATSEPEDFLRIGERKEPWSMMVGLIGEGQEIHLGEEAGLGQWNNAIATMHQSWHVHCPGKINGIFSAAAGVQVDDSLDLTLSLRSHIAEDVQDWVKALLDGRVDDANRLSTRVRHQGFDAYVTRDIEQAKAYVRERYYGNLDMRYGLLASSKAKNISQYGIENSFNFTKVLKEGPWFNDPPSSHLSCCQFHDVATEFACQGLELDMPLIAWGNDLKWVDDRWLSPPQPRSHAKNPHLLRVNSYRVLLTRGRDGFILFVPPDSEMDTTFGVLREAGIPVLVAKVEKAA